MSIKVRPINDRVLARREKPQEKSKGGILLPETQQKTKKSTVCTVLAVGPGAWVEDGSHRRELPVKVGDKILVHQYAGNSVDEMNEGDELIIITENEILGIVE